MQKNIIWLASYPKSGNTWFRMFLSALLKPDDEDFDINMPKKQWIFSDRMLFEQVAGVEASDLTFEEQYLLRPEVYRSLAENKEGNYYIKIHDAFIYNKANQPIVPPETSKLAVYIVRNPLDVAVSYAHHNNDDDIELTIDKLCSKDHGICVARDRLQDQLPQRMLDWSSHVNSWLDQKEIPVLMLRYEDMKHDPMATFTKALRHLGINYTVKSIADAIEDTRFEKLKKQERVSGFQEGIWGRSDFFRKGETGTWRNILKPQHIRQIIDCHSATMKRLGYLDENNKPVY